MGYDFAQAVLSSGGGLLVCVWANVSLWKQMGYVRESMKTVYGWPEKAAAGSDPPLVTRHFIAQGPQHPIHLIVTLPPGQRLSDRQVADINRARWVIEVYYRHFKQTSARRKLRSHAANNTRDELEWSLVGLWFLLLYASDELNRQEILLDCLSAAGSLKAFRQIARDFYHAAETTNTLLQRLRHALIDTYPRTNKVSRDYHQIKQICPTAGPPKIHRADKSQSQLTRSITQLQPNG
ncbi:MAG: hypothetical protein KDA86_10550 [Planctomycetaceae bacterium]|nr:hypothetical protein [Planctomycetaceae bacterium]